MDAEQWQSFSKWGIERKRFVLGAVAASVGIPGLEILGKVSETSNKLISYIPKQVFWYVLNLAALSILAVILGLAVSKLGEKAQKPNSSEAVHIAHEFSRWWLSAWCLWLIQYFFLCSMYWPIVGMDGHKLSIFEAAGNFHVACPEILNALLNWISVGTAYCFLRCYFTIVFGRAFTHGITWTLRIVLGVVMFLYLAYATSLLFGPISDGIKMGWLIALGIGGGFVTCVCMCMLIGRLESRIISPPLIMIFLLYCYAALQIAANGNYYSLQILKLPSFNHIVGIGDLKVLLETSFGVMLFFALLLKTLMFIFFYWLIESGVLVFFIEWMRSNGRVGDTSSATTIEAARVEYIERYHRNYTPPPPELRTL